MKPVQITVANPGVRFQASIPIRCGVPLQEGACHSAKELVVTKNGQIIHSQFTALTFWPDGSLRWILVECYLDIESSHSVDIFVELASNCAPYVDQSAGSNRRITAQVNPEVQDNRAPVPRLSAGEGLADLFDKIEFRLIGSDNKKHTFKKHGETICVPGKLRSEFLTRGSFVNEIGVSVLALETRLDAYSDCSRFKLSITLHNKSAAHHAGGFWDLGDKGSFVFNEFAVVFRGLENSTLCWDAGDSNWREQGSKNLKITQLSSGGSNSASPNHLNAENNVPSVVNGYTVEVGGEIAERGARVSPRIQMTSVQSSWVVCVDSFWQNFPKTIHREEDSLTIGLFPDDYPDLFELQGGEKKTHSIYLGRSVESLDWINSGVTPYVALDSLRLARVLPFSDDVPADSEMDCIIEQGLDGPRSFFLKREWIDEYGWRNFGDVYADHETSLLESPQLFSSHYNNQYDLVYGFMRMFMLSARQGWFQLARDLAEHVMDIDIYDTQHDRVEYNGGLFWHTNHYHPAMTSSHRSYSRLHEYATGEVAGGGPGGEHCYTSGLKLYYLITGNERARKTVLQLANWVRCFYDGSGTVLEELLRILRSRGSLLFRVARGASVSRHNYPIHRGIGNLIVAQLDSFEVTCEREYLETVERVILEAIGPQDNLIERGLRNIEQNWFYSIFLQALIRYLDIKRQLKEFDTHFFYARDSLLHYADWIVAEEMPYLDNPDDLEYPNHTWAAQDVRRCAILLDAYRYAGEERAEYLERARFFGQYVTAELKNAPTRTYTRILAILMQNHGATAIVKTTPQRYVLPSEVPYTAILHIPHTVRSLLGDDARRLLTAIQRFSLKAEWKWLQHRVR